MKKYILFALMFAPMFASASIDTNIRYGSRGAAVTELQEFLIDKGFLTGTATGNFYTLTKKAVMAYQTQQNLPATGFVGAMTREKINAELSATVSEEEITTPVVQEKSALQKQLDDLLAQIKTLTEQQKTLADEQKKATQDTNQVLGSIQQNTTPAPVPETSIQPLDKSELVVTTLNSGEKIKTESGYIYQFGFELTVKDKNGKTFDWSKDYEKAGNAQPPNIHIVVTKDNNLVKDYYTYDANYPWGKGNNQYSPSFVGSGIYKFTFSTNGLTNSTTIEVK